MNYPRSARLKRCNCGRAEAKRRGVVEVFGWPPGMAEKPEDFEVWSCDWCWAGLEPDVKVTTREVST